MTAARAPARSRLGAARRAIAAAAPRNGEIARHLVVSDATVKTHVSHVLQKLSLRDRIQAVVFAYDSGIVTPGG
jgi:FixJ family two-component response regulator